MQALLAPVKELAEYDRIREMLQKGKGPAALTGCVDSQKLHMVYGFSEGCKVKAATSP